MIQVVHEDLDLIYLVVDKSNIIDYTIMELTFE